jgi:hypothetical protein
VCDTENLKNEEAMTLVGSQRHSKKKSPNCHSLVETAVFIAISATDY